MRKCGFSASGKTHLRQRPLPEITGSYRLSRSTLAAVPGRGTLFHWTGSDSVFLFSHTCRQWVVSPFFFQCLNRRHSNKLNFRTRRCFQFTLLLCWFVMRTCMFEICCSRSAATFWCHKGATLALACELNLRNTIYSKTAGISKYFFFIKQTFS